MAEYTPRAFGYAHSTAVMRGLQAHARSRREVITDAYAYIDEPGDHEMFWKLIEVARQSGKDIHYIDSVKELAGHSLADFKAALTAVENAGMKVHSQAERDYDYATFIAVIEVLEDLTPTYRKNNQRIAAITMHTMGADIAKICEDLDMPQSEVYEAIASYKRSLEEAGIE